MSEGKVRRWNRRKFLIGAGAFGVACPGAGNDGEHSRRGFLYRP